MVRIVHASDWHNEWRQLPEADLYIITGDMLDTYPIVEQKNGGWGFKSFISREIVPAREQRLQREWYERKFERKGRTLRSFLKSKDAPVVCVRGNHDFTDLGPMFGGEVFEVQSPRGTVEYCGLKIGGFRGINYIAGEWSDELRESAMRDVVANVPNDLDIVVSHTPPAGILDDYYGEKCGSAALTAYISECLYKHDRAPRLFCFGHIHNQAGIMRWDDGTTFSNAACTVNEIDLDI